MFTFGLGLRPPLAARHPPVSLTQTLGSSSSDAELVAVTKRWVAGMVVGHNLCPFAGPVRDHTRYVVCRSRTLETFEAELRRLHAVDPDEPATTLILLPGDEFFAEFAALMELQPAVQDLAEPMGIQILPFHPLASYDDEYEEEEEEEVEEEEEEEGHGLPSEHAARDASDFSGRSPVPMLHLLREADVYASEDDWFSRGGVPIQQRNAAYLRGLGYQQVEALRAAVLAGEPVVLPDAG
eukprot:Transcript_24463.p1 GENE.Transcript_24463~~Transcript_24463.p1  ORF type:complete len:254 (+),score=99.83 Transcript_24463:46-762(+)